MAERVFVHRNLNRKGVVWSVLSCRTRRVLDRVGFILLEDAELVVSEAGRERVRRTGRKSVHAGVRGTPMDYPHSWSLFSRPWPPRGWRRVEYNPYRDDGFIYSRTKRPVGKVKRALLCHSGCWVSR